MAEEVIHQETQDAPEPKNEPTPEPNDAPETPATETASVAEAADDDGEPGGSSPQEIRARKEYRARRGVEKQLESERIERVRLEERLRTLEEVSRATPPVPAERIFTPQEVQAAIDAGQVSAAEGMTYLAKQEAKRVIAEQLQATQAARPFQMATSEVTEYMQHLPWTKDYNSPEFQQVKAEYNRLVTDLGYANDIRTQAVALRAVVGPLDKIKARAQVATQTRQVRRESAFVELPSGGALAPKSDGIDKAPAEVVRIWDRTGLSPAQRAKEWSYHQKQQKAG